MIRKLISIINNKTVSNGIWMYVLQFFNMIVPLFTLPYITRILGSGAYGTFSVALNIVSYLQVLVEYGFVMSATRKVAIANVDLNKLFTTVIVSRAFLLIPSFLIALFYVFLNHNNNTLCYSFIILLLCLIGNCVQMNWLFQGLQEMKYISIVNVIGRTISVTLIFIFVKRPEDIFLYCFLYSISPFMSGFIGLIIAKNKYKLKFVKIKLKDIFLELKDGVYVFTTQLSAKVFGAIGITFLGLFATESTVGVFSAIQKIPNILILFWTPIAQVIYPLSSHHFSKGFKEGYYFVQSVRKKIMPLFIMLAIVVGLLGKIIVGLMFGKEYDPYYYWLFPLLGWMIIAIDNNFLGIQIMLGSGHDEEYGVAFEIGVTCTIILNFVLIKLFTGFGAAIAPLISEFILSLLLRWKIRPTLKREL